MKKQTANAIKTLLRMDASVTSEERMRIVAALNGERPQELFITADMPIAEVAEYLGLSRTTLWRRITDGSLAAVRRGKKFYIPGEVVRRMKGSI